MYTRLVDFVAAHALHSWSGVEAKTHGVFELTVAPELAACGDAVAHERCRDGGTGRHVITTSWVRAWSLLSEAEPLRSRQRRP